MPIDTLPMARAFLKSTSAEREAQEALIWIKTNPNAFELVLAWHREHKRAARHLFQQLQLLGVHAALLVDPPDVQHEEVATAKAFAILCATGDVHVAKLGMRMFSAEKVLLGTARMFLANGCQPGELKAWASETEEHEAMWIKVFESGYAPSTASKEN